MRGRTIGLLSAGVLAVGMALAAVTIIAENRQSGVQSRSTGVATVGGPFRLTGTEGQTVSEKDLLGKPSAVFFGFTYCPDVCPTSMSVLDTVDWQLQSSDPELAEQFQGILVSVDPDRDSSETLARYATAFSPRFLGVTGQREDLVGLTTQVNVAFAKVPLSAPAAYPAPSDDAVSDVSEDAYTVDHTGNIVIINPMGHYHGFIKLPHDPETIRLTFQTLASQF